MLVLSLAASLLPSMLLSSSTSHRPHCHYRIDVTHIDVTVITSLAKEVMFLEALVCLFVCLFVDNITQNMQMFLTIITG